MDKQQLQDELEHATIRHYPHTNFYDVFTGMGWDNHSRVLVKPNFRHVMSGVKLEKELLNQLDFTKDDRIAE